MPKPLCNTCRAKLRTVGETSPSAEVCVNNEGDISIISDHAFQISLETVLSYAVKSERGLTRLRDFYDKKAMLNFVVK